MVIEKPAVSRWCQKLFASGTRASPVAPATTVNASSAMGGQVRVHAGGMDSCCIYTDESWGPTFFSFTVCKGPKESHAVDINYINSGAGNKQVKACSASLDNPATAVIRRKKERGVSKAYGRASFWPQVIVRVIKQTQTNPNKKNLYPQFIIKIKVSEFSPRHWDVKKIIQFKQGGVINPMGYDPCFFSAIFLGVIEVVRGPTWCFALLQLPSFCS